MSVVVPITVGAREDVPPEGAACTAYVALLAEALADGTITDEEACGLAGHASRVETSCAEIEGLHRALLEFMRRVADEGGGITAPGRQVLVLGSGPAADDLRGLAVAFGVEIAWDLTARVTHVVLAGPVDAAEPRLARARAYGVPVCSPEKFVAEIAGGRPRRPFERLRRVLPGRIPEGEMP